MQFYIEAFFPELFPPPVFSSIFLLWLFLRDSSFLDSWNSVSFLFRQNAEGIAVRLGEYDHTKSTETRHRDFSVVAIKQHEEFQLATYTNDIAVVTLDKSAAFDTYVWPICMPPIGRSFENETAVSPLLAQFFLWGFNKVCYLKNLIKHPMVCYDSCFIAIL